MTNLDPRMHGTTILCVKKGKDTVIAADGQISFGNMVLKSTARKIRRLAKGEIIAGFAGSTADSLTLFERLEAKIEKHHHQLLRAATELAKDWRNDKYMRRLEAMLLVANKDHILLVSGSGDVIEPEFDVAAIGSGGFFALAAAKALINIDNIDLTAEDIARRAMSIAAEICVFSNNNIVVEKIHE